MLLFVALSAPAAAAYRCVDGKGKVTYQDSACESAKSATTVDTSDALSTRPQWPRPRSNGSAEPGVAVAAQPSIGAVGDYSSSRGTWRGPVQFQLSAGGVRDPNAQGLAQMVVEIKPTGEVLGMTGDAGCRISGLANQFMQPTAVSLDVTLKSCGDSRFNARYSGHLIVSSAARETSLTLTAIGTVLPSTKSQQATLSAVLRR